MSRQKLKARWHSANGLLVLATSYSRTAYRRTTIGAAAFHCRVRNGNGWGHCANVTRVRNRTGISLLSQRRRREAESLGHERLTQTPYNYFQKNMIFNPHSAIENPQSPLVL